MTRPVEGAEAIDPDVGLHVLARRDEPRGPVLAAVAAGGALGATARYGVGLMVVAALGAVWAAGFGRARCCGGPGGGRRLLG
jgi:CrcB protein